MSTASSPEYSTVPGAVPQAKSDEDKQLQEELAFIVNQLSQGSPESHLGHLDDMSRLIQASTTSITSVPKPLKYMRPHYPAMKEIFKKIRPGESQQKCAAILSVLAMTMGSDKECLIYLMLCDSARNIGEWGHEYVRHLGKIVTTFCGKKSLQKTHIYDRLLNLAKQITEYHMRHNAEVEACDLLMELEKLDMIEDYVDNETYPKVFQYLLSTIPHVPSPENVIIMEILFRLTREFKNFAQSLRMAVLLNDKTRISEVLAEVGCPDLRKQLAFMLSLLRVSIEPPEDLEDYEAINDIISNVNGSDLYLKVGRALDILEPKVPEDIYKTHLDNLRALPGGRIDSSRQNLSATFVNSFINAAFGVDKLLNVDGLQWIYKNKEHGMLSATASIGLLYLWDIHGGLTAIDRYLYSTEDLIKAGAFLGCGIINCSVRSEVDPAHALLSDYVTDPNQDLSTCAVLGLGIAYAGSNKPNVLETLKSLLMDESKFADNYVTVSLAALCIGLISVSTANKDMTELLLTTITKLDTKQLQNPYTKFMFLGLGLLYLGLQETIEATMEVLAVLPEPFQQMALVIIEVCAYAGTGNVLKVQHLLHICSECHSSKSQKKQPKGNTKNEKDKRQDILGETQAIAVLGIALIAMQESIGAEMALRSLGHLMRYGESQIRRAVPLAMGLLSVSNAKISVIEVLSKFSHDTDEEVSYNATFAMGLVGAGTNDARLAAILRQLAQYHADHPLNLFLVRLAQGLVHLGKGMLTLNPYDSEHQIMSSVSAASLMITLVTFLDVRETILGKSHYLLYCLVPAMRPRILVTLNEKLEVLPVSVRVGTAVDVVGLAGRPKTITGFQTHMTPVLLQDGERAELATEDYKPLSPILEGFVILKENENSENEN